MFFLWPALMALLFVGLPTAMWLSTRREADERWLPRVDGTERVGVGSYRDAVIPRFVGGGPPWEVRVAALSSWILGTMFVPGLMGGLFGLFFAGIGLISVPGLVLAWRLFFLGAPLLRGEPEAAVKARAAARFARVLNVVVLAACGVAAMTQVPNLVHHNPSSDAADVLTGAGMVVFYAMISLTHAHLLTRAAKRIDDQHDAVRQAMSGVRVDASSVTGDLRAAPEGDDEARTPRDADSSTRRS